MRPTACRLCGMLDCRHVCPPIAVSPAEGPEPAPSWALRRRPTKGFNRCRTRTSRQSSPALPQCLQQQTTPQPRPRPFQNLPEIIAARWACVGSPPHLHPFFSSALSSSSASCELRSSTYFARSARAPYRLLEAQILLSPSAARSLVQTAIGRSTHYVLWLAFPSSFRPRPPLRRSCTYKTAPRAAFVHHHHSPRPRLARPPLTCRENKKHSPPLAHNR